MDAVERFAAIVRAPEIDLAEAALTIAAAAHPSTNVSFWLDVIASLAEDVDDLDALRFRLFVDRGLHGNVDDYTDPENSFLDSVIQRGLGIPISLSVLLIETGRRAGIALEPIGMPGHFLVRDPSSGMYIDAFDAGAMIDVYGAEVRFRRATGVDDDVVFSTDLLPVVEPREILDRMLNNLRNGYVDRGGPRDLEWVCRMRLSMPDADPEEVLELAEALAMQGRTTEGAAEIVTYAERFPLLRDTLHQAATAMQARLN